MGDVHPEVAEVAGAITPVPGGVGPLTIAMLMFNTVKAAKMRRGSRVPELSHANLKWLFTTETQRHREDLFVCFFSVSLRLCGEWSSSGGGSC